MNFNIKNFDLTFEAKGLRPLFQGVSLETYMPQESVLLIKANVGSSYISKKMLEKMKIKGIDLFSQENLTVINDLKSVIKQAYEKGDFIDQKNEITIEDVKACFQSLRDLSAVYGYFDNGYLDGAYEAAKTSSQAAINVKEIETYKNISREDINRIFFEKGGLWDNLLTKISARFNVDRNELEWYLESEIYALFENKVCSQESIENRKVSFVFYKDDSDKVIFLEGSKSLEFIDEFNLTDKKQEFTSVIKGKTAHQIGRKVMGRVYNMSADYSNLAGLGKEMDEMKAGEILVSQTTAPELIPALRKASAIVTDIGGMLSHAAIVSRELGIPCIVATGNASKILKTGDMVEVDTEKGIVTIIS